jgi:hypothetical protein
MILGSMVLLLSGAAWVGFCYIAQKKIDSYKNNSQENLDHDLKFRRDDDAGAHARLITNENIYTDDCMNSSIDHSKSDFQSDLSNEYQQNMFGMGRDL